MVKYCLHNPDMTRGEALVSGKKMDCKGCLRKIECRDSPILSQNNTKEDGLPPTNKFVGIRPTIL